MGCSNCSGDFGCFFSSRRRHTRFDCDWSSDVCSSDLTAAVANGGACAPNIGFANGRWQERTATSAGVQLLTSQCTELSFMLSTATATVNQVYRFRLVSATSYASFASVATPTIQIVSSQTKKFSKNGPSG